MTKKKVNQVETFGLEHIGSCRTERFDISDEPNLERTLGDFTGRIGEFYLVLPRGGYRTNPTILEAHRDRVYVNNHFDLGLFGEIALVHRKKVVASLPDTRLAHLWYATDNPSISTTYSMDCQNPDSAGSEYIDLAQKVPERLIANREGSRIVLVGDVSVHILFARLKQQVEEIMRKHLKW